MGACAATIIIVVVVLLWYCYCFFSFLPRLNDFLFSSLISRWGHFMWLLPWHMEPSQVLQFHLQRHTWNMLFELLACRDEIPVTGVILFRYRGPTHHCTNKGSKPQVILSERIQLLLFWQLLWEGQRNNLKYSQYWEPCHRCWIIFTEFLFVSHGENSCYVSNRIVIQSFRALSYPQSGGSDRTFELHKRCFAHARGIVLPKVRSSFL